MGRCEGTACIYVGGAAYGAAESGLAHELGHWLIHLWLEVCGPDWPHPIWERPGLRRLLREAREYQEGLDEYANDPSEIWARLFETFVAWELEMLHPRCQPTACPGFWPLANGFYTDDGPKYFQDYGFATDWGLFAERMRRWVRRLLREIRAGPRWE